MYFIRHCPVWLFVEWYVSTPLNHLTTIEPFSQIMHTNFQYRGPYMGIMDLQARLLAGVMSGRLSLDKGQFQAALDTNKLIRTANPRAQFPRFDYTGKIDSYLNLAPTVSCPGAEFLSPSTQATWIV
jgi:hypothetical protein